MPCPNEVTCCSGRLGEASLPSLLSRRSSRSVRVRGRRSVVPNYVSGLKRIRSGSTTTNEPGRRSASSFNSSRILGSF